MADGLWRSWLGLFSFGSGRGSSEALSKLKRFAGIDGQARSGKLWAAVMPSSGAVARRVVSTNLACPGQLLEHSAACKTSAGGFNWLLVVAPPFFS